MKKLLFLLLFVFVQPCFAQSEGALPPPPSSDVDLDITLTPEEEILLEEAVSSPDGVAVDLIETGHEEIDEPVSDVPMIQTPGVRSIKTADQPKTTTDGKGLTDNLRSSSDQPSSTWIDKLKSTSDTADASLEKMVKDAKKTGETKRSNASVFDVSGVMLRMSLEQVENTLKTRAFKKTMEKLEIPNFIRWRNEEFCRNSGVVGYENIQSCVVKIAKKDGHQYTQTIAYTKFDTKEEVTVLFTSNFTKNKAYKIVYKSMAPNITGNSQKAIYIRNIKIYDFWKKINQKYGAPDDRENVIWGLGENKPYMIAKTGELLLEDPMLRELDYTRMSREDQRFLNTDLYSF